MDANSQASLPVISIDYADKPGLGKLAIINYILTIITLGFYLFWGKTNVRKHIWSEVNFNGDSLEYTGTGKELFLGFLVVLFVVILPIAIIQNGSLFYFGQDSVIAQILQAIVVIPIYYLINVAIYRARRYRLSRTLWRGIRGTMTGSPWRYGGYAFGMYILSFFTLGILFPWVRTKLNKRIMEETIFGDKTFVFEGSSKPLFKSFFINIFLFAISAIVFAFVLTPILSLASGVVLTEGSLKIWAIFLIGAIPFVAYILLALVFWSRYKAFEMNYFASCTRFDQAEFAMTASGGSLFKLFVWNLLITLFTLGVAAPFALRNVVRYFITRFSIIGQIDFDAIKQSQARLDKTGEGLAEAFDIDAF